MQSKGAGIYIPLCFYFNFIDFVKRFYRYLFTFHYASTLMWWTIIPLRIFSIYIPLCFYFNDRRIYQNIRLICIYIPLCFYFNSFCPTMQNPHPIFTFHYASTLIPVAHYSRLILILIYIPLCFYFNRFPAVKSNVFVKFTFHYASTLIQTAVYYWYLQSWFTFHYASTLMTHSPRTPSEKELIYIPLCFYFNWHITNTSCFKTHLHSTMLLL